MSRFYHVPISGVTPNTPRLQQNLLFSHLCCFLVLQDLLSILVNVQKYIEFEDLRLVQGSNHLSCECPEYIKLEDLRLGLTT